MTSQAYKYLLQRVRGTYLPKADPEPVAVRNARRMIERYDRIAHADRSKRAEALEAARQKAREVIHAGDYEAALKAVKEFERMKF